MIHKVDLEYLGQGLTVMLIVSVFNKKLWIESTLLNKLRCRKQVHVDATQTALEEEKEKKRKERVPLIDKVYIHAK